MEKRIENLEKVILQIKERNQRVEANKAWETSWHRKGSILVLTYTLVVVFFLVINLPNPFVNANSTYFMIFVIYTFYKIIKRNTDTAFLQKKLEKAIDESRKICIMLFDIFTYKYY